MSATCGATAVSEDPLAVELGVTPRRFAEATGPRRRAAPAGGWGVKISEFAVALGGAGESMHRYSNRRPPLIHLALLPMTTRWRAA